MVECDQMSQPTFSKGRKFLLVVLFPLAMRTDFVSAHDSQCSLTVVRSLNLIPVALVVILLSRAGNIMCPRRLCHSARVVVCTLDMAVNANSVGILVGRIFVWSVSKLWWTYWSMGM